MDLPIKIVNLFDEGENLEKLGINNFALTKIDALHLLELLEKYNKPVYGGDVFVRNQNRIELTHDNWFCEREKNENDDSFIKRNISFAKNYIENYRTTENGEKLFAIIFDRTGDLPD